MPPSNAVSEQPGRYPRSGPYRGMDRVTLDLAYDNVRAVPGVPVIMGDFRARSDALYAATPGHRDLAYGPLPAQRVDWLRCGVPDAPLFVFIHGGYWQARSKEDFAFVASGPLGCGFDVLLAEYTLAPDATMTQIVGEIGGLLDYLVTDPDELGSAGRVLCLAGHSAGGQLSALHRAHPAVAHAMPISALVDLEPIAMSWLDEKLKLTDAEIDAYSPLRHIGPGAPMTITVGDGELAELVRHSREYAEACDAAGERVRFVPLDAANHFTVLDDLALPDGVQMRALMADMTREGSLKR